MAKDDVTAGAVGVTAFGGLAVKVGGLGGAGLAIGGSAYAISAVAVVVVPAVAGGLLTLGAWKGAKALRQQVAKRRTR